MRARLEAGSYPKTRDSASAIGGVKDVGAGHKRGGSSLHTLRPCIRVDTAIDLDHHVVVPRVELCFKIADLSKGAWDEGLPAPPRIYRHDEHEVADIEHIEDRIYWGAWINRDTVLHPKGADLGERTVKVGARLLMDNQTICSSLLKGMEMALWLNHHEVDVEEDLRPLPNRLDYVCPKGDRGHKGPIHNIDVEPISASRYHIIHLCP